jgi:hypothetical protein
MTLPVAYLYTVELKDDNKQMKREGFERNRLRPNLKYSRCIFWGELRKTMKYLKEGSGFSGRDLNTGSPEYDT